MLKDFTLFTAIPRTRAILGTALAAAALVLSASSVQAADWYGSIAPSSTDVYAVEVNGLSKHFNVPLNPKYHWNERNWGLGIERRVQLDDGWTRKDSFGFMEDSLSSYGLYSSVVFQKELNAGSELSVKLGAGGFLFYRTMQFNGPRLLVPAVLPVVSAEYKPWGLGFNLLAVPRIESENIPALVFGQLTKTF